MPRASLSQLSRLDNRTTSGSWRIARTSTSSGSAKRWVGHGAPGWCQSAFSQFQALSHGALDGANLLDWPVGYDELAPYYTC